MYGKEGLMSKLYIFLAFVCLGILLTFGLVAPDNSVMWLASTTPVFTAVRGGMMLILLGLLVTNPPRNVYFRVITGTASLLLITWCLNAFYHNQLQLADFLSLMPAGIAAGIAALEPDYQHTDSKASA
jgi:hypothetical protein